MGSQTYQHLRTRRAGAVEYLELNRPDVRNALSDRTVGFRIDDEDLADLKTVRDAVDYVHERTREGA